MKRKGIILGFVVMLVAAALLYSKIALTENIRANKANESINFYTNPGGTGLVKKGEITPTGKLRVGTIEDLAGSGTPPGMIPVGGMVAVMPSTHASAWEPPDTGVIKDGFMRANGHTITAQNVTDGSLFPAGTALPDMRNRFTRGSPDATSGTESGNDSVTPSGTVSQPSFNGVAVTRSTWFKNQAISATNPGHYHSMSGAGATLDVGALGATNVSLSNGSMSAAEFEHNHSLGGNVSGGTASLTGTTTFVTGVNPHTDLALSNHTFTNPYVPKHYHYEGNHSSGLTANNYDFGIGSFTVAISDPGHSHSLSKSNVIVASGGAAAERALLNGGTDYYTFNSMQNASTGITASILKSNFDHPHTISGYVGENESGSCNGDESNTCQTTGGSVSAHSFSQNISAHSVNTSSVGINPTAAGNGTLFVGADNISTARTVTGTTNIAHDHGLTGSIGKVTGGCDGDVSGSCSVTFNVNNDNMQEWSATGDYTPSGTVSQPSFSGNALDNKPAYTTVVWVIRVM